ncbi:hypothetical protein MGH68_11860 [Erysipelothrix sp. D19-032]
MHIDKKKLTQQYKNPHDVYDLAMTFLLERITLFLNRNNKRAVILIESRGKKEDKVTLNTVKKLKINGNNFISSETFDVVEGIYFDKKEPRAERSRSRLEISDVICYSLHRYYTVGDNLIRYNQVRIKQLKNKSSFKKFP